MLYKGIGGGNSRDMMQGRFVAYIYRYKGGNVKDRNSGFIKVQRMSRNSDKCRIHINIKDVEKKDQTSCRVYIYGQLYKNLICEFLICRGQGESRIDVSWNDVTGDGLGFDSYQGIVIECEDGTIYATSWCEAVVSPKQILEYEKRDAAATTESSVKDNNEEKHIVWGKVEIVDDSSEEDDTASDDMEEQEISEQKISEQKMSEQKMPEQNLEKQNISGQNTENNSCQSLIQNNPKIEKLDDKRFFDCVKIEPQDIGKLNMANWQLGVNSFLSHGYFNYKHLMLGKIKFSKNEDRYIIGVPGVYSNKEKYLANMFGFTTFIPAKNMRVMTGSFGYWVIEIKE